MDPGEFARKMRQKYPEIQEIEKTLEDPRNCVCSRCPIAENCEFAYARYNYFAEEPGGDCLAAK